MEDPIPKQTPSQPPRLPSKKMPIIIASVFLLIVLVPILSGLYLDFLWFKNLGFGQVFTKIIYTQIWIVLAAAAIFFILQTINLLFADKQDAKVKRKHVPKRIISLKIKLGILAAISLIIGFGYKSSWEKILLYMNQVSFNTYDPIFGKDIAFYVFTLPFLNLALKFLMVIIIVGFIITALTYFFNGQISWMNIANTPQQLETKQVSFNLKASKKSKYHLSFLGSLFFVLLAASYYLKRYSVLYSTRGIITGAGYTDVNVTLPIFTFLIIVSVIVAVELFIWPKVLKKKNIILISITAFVIIAFVALSVIPGLVQYFKVLPNEFKVEQPFIDNNIEYTRLAYGLDKIKEIDYDATSDLSPTALEDSKEMLNNIRLWDHRPLKQTYNQLQEIRLYYNFNDVDIDRYTIDGKYSQVMLSARELNPGQLQSAAQTWVNQKLVFTHGLGVTLSPVNEFTSEGLPKLLVKDLPPQTEVKSLEITRPQIYYGEGPQDYVITNTATKEFDYAKGDKNVYNTYKGKGGVEIGSFWRKLLFALRFGDMKLLLTGDISPESKVLFYRDLDERLKKIAPFLTLDQDPYIVISDGKLKWMQDAYTTADSFPYSSYVQISDYKYINYVRNSIKVVMDAYDGTPTFYVSDPSDPIINTYANIFPDLFTSIENMPLDLRSHVRYPEKLFKIQSAMYGTYHMRDPNVFYNKEDVWSIPNEVYGEGREIKMDPYHIIMKLPGEENEEFILMSPFTPQNKDNMIGWLAARADGEEYGKLVIYKFPKERLIYGPMQIEARIDQDATISEQLTLWGQRGSTIIRGNLLVIPIDNSILYAEPLYLIAEKTQLPELKRIIVSDGKTVIMERDLDVALNKLFKTTDFTSSSGESPDDKEQAEISDGIETQIEFEKDLIAQAIQYHKNIGESMRDGDWAGIGENYNNLGQVLEKLDAEN